MTGGKPKPPEVETPSAVWVVDSCSLLYVKELPVEDQTICRHVLKRMVAEGSVVFPAQVAEELCRYQKKDATRQWVEHNKPHAVRHAVDLLEVRVVLSKVPHVLDFEKPSAHDEADPYILQLARQLTAQGHNTVVVTEERVDSPRKMSMNTACGLLRLVCMSMRAFLHEVGVRDFAYDKTKPGASDPLMSSIS